MREVGSTRGCPIAEHTSAATVGPPDRESAEGQSPLSIGVTNVAPNGGTVALPKRRGRVTEFDLSRVRSTRGAVSPGAGSASADAVPQRGPHCPRRLR